MAHTTSTSAAAWRPDVSQFDPAEAIPEALVLATSTVCANIEGDKPSLRVAYVADAPAGFVAEGADIPEADPTMAECVVCTGKCAQLIKLSREQFNQEGASEQLAASVARAVTSAANAAYIAQTPPTAPAVNPPAGLLHVANIVNGGAVAGDLDKLVDLVAELQSNGAAPTHVLLSPTAWASLRKLKTATDSALTILGAGTSDAAPLLLSIPVLVTPAVPTNTGLILDKAAIVSAVGSVEVAQSEHAYFASDGIALRCTWRFGANVVRPDRIGKFTVTPPA